jgi:hypothetical protein
MFSFSGIIGVFVAAGILMLLAALWIACLVGMEALTNDATSGSAPHF